jgi:hypothetical protein
MQLVGPKHGVAMKDFFVMQHPRPTRGQPVRPELRSSPLAPACRHPVVGRRPYLMGGAGGPVKVQIEVEFYGGGDGNIGLVLGGVGS